MSKKKSITITTSEQIIIKVKLDGRIISRQLLQVNDITYIVPSSKNKKPYYKTTFFYYPTNN